MVINILILSAGRRVELVKCFKEAAKIKRIESNIVTADISKTAPATYFGDKNYTIPKIGDDGYIEAVINICNKENIMLVIPTIDTELKILSENKKLIEKETNAKILISDKKVIDICINKKNTNKFFEENGERAGGVRRTAALVQAVRGKDKRTLVVNGGGNGNG